jgi:hypothetical protein
MKSFAGVQGVVFQKNPLVAEGKKIKKPVAKNRTFCYVNSLETFYEGL